MAEEEEVPTSYEETLEASRLLAAWSRSLRQWSRITRERSREGRAARSAIPGLSMPDLTGPVDEPSLGEVPIVDLFVILVEQHGFEVREAVRQLTLGMMAAGYQAEAERVGAADAMDIIEAIVGRPDQ